MKAEKKKAKVKKAFLDIIKEVDKSTKYSRKRALKKMVSKPGFKY